MSQKRFKKILLNYPRLFGLLYLLACGIINVNTVKQDDKNNKEGFISSDLFVTSIDLDDDLINLNLMPENEERNARAIAIKNSVLTYGSGVYTTDTTAITATALPLQKTTQAQPSQDGSKITMIIVIIMSIGSALSAAGLISAIIYCLKMVNARKNLIRPLPNISHQPPTSNINSSNNNSNNKTKSPQSNNSKKNSNNNNSNNSENKKKDQSRSQSRSLRSNNSGMTDVSV